MVLLYSLRKKRPSLGSVTMVVVCSTLITNNSERPQPSFVPPELPEALLTDCSSRRRACGAGADGAGAHHPGVLGAAQPALDLSQVLGEQRRKHAKILEQRLQLDVSALEQRNNHRKERLRYQATLRARQVLEQLNETLRSEEAVLDGELQEDRRSLETKAAAEKLDMESKAAMLTLAVEARKLQSKMARLSPRLEVPSLFNFAVRESLRGKAAAALEKPAEEFVGTAKDLPSRIAEARAYGVEAGLVAEAERIYTKQVLTGFHAKRAHERLLQAISTGRSDMPGLPLQPVGPLPCGTGIVCTSAAAPTNRRTVTTKRIVRKVEHEEGGPSLPSTAASSEPEDDE